MAAVLLGRKVGQFYPMNMSANHDGSSQPTRRRLVMVGGTLVAGFAAALIPRLSFATPEEARRLLEQLTAGRVKFGKIKLDMSSIAENGALVPIAIKVDHPMTEEDYVAAVYLIAERNPFPSILTATFTPLSGRAELQTRIRLAESQKVAAVARLADGTFWVAEQSVEVTVGGCVN